MHFSFHHQLCSTVHRQLRVRLSTRNRICGVSTREITVCITQTYVDSSVLLCVLSLSNHRRWCWIRSQCCNIYNLAYPSYFIIFTAEYLLTRTQVVAAYMIYSCTHWKICIRFSTDVRLMVWCAVFSDFYFIFLRLSYLCFYIFSIVVVSVDVHYIVWHFVVASFGDLTRHSQKVLRTTIRQ